jgi:DNA-binding LacI/PurR family transcriptional regulator
MNRKVTLRDVAERAGVSRSAVSRAFTDGASVSPQTRARIETAVAALNYSPNLIARSLTTRRTKLVGLVSNNFRNPVFLEIFDLFTQGLQDRGLRPLLVNLSGETDPERSVQLLRAYSVDGAIIASSHVPTGFARAFHEAGVPVVHAFGRIQPQPEVSTVGIDNVGAGAMAARILVARGYRRVGFLGGPESASTTQDRLAGFMGVVAEAPGVTATASFAAAYSFDAGRAEMARLIAEGTSALPEAYFCGDDVLSVGALSAAAEAGLQVPQDLGILGLNDMAISGWANINLTTIHQPFAAIIASAVDLMLTQFDTPDAGPQTRTFPCHIVERGTLRPLPS